MAQAPRRLSIADVLGFGSTPQRNLTQGYRQAVNRPAPRTTGTLKAVRPTAAQELAQLLTPDTRFGAELAAKIEPAVEMSPLGLLTGLVDARRQYKAGNTGQAAGTGILAALGAIPGGKAGGKVAREAAGELKPLTKSQFAKEYMQHVDLRGRAGDAAKRMEKIIKEGFEPGFGPNLLPIWMGGQPKNIIEEKFVPRSGDIVYLVPKSGREKTSGGAFRISRGWKPEPFETVKLTDDFSDIYSEYLKGFKQNNVKIKLSDIEHGESAMPGGKLTWPGARDLIADYAMRDTPFPPIEVIKNDPGDAFPYMIYDGSHRYEAAKLRGNDTIDAIIVGE